MHEWRVAQQRLRTLEEQQKQLLAAFSAMSEQNRQTIAGLQVGEMAANRTSFRSTGSVTRSVYLSFFSFGIGWWERLIVRQVHLTDLNEEAMWTALTF